METVRSGNTFTITLPAGKTNEGYELFAYTDVNGKPQVLGKLDVLTFPFVRPKVCLVPVRVAGKDPIVPDANKVKDELNKIYKPYAVEFEVTVAKEVFDNQAGWDYDGDGSLNISGTGLFSNLSDEMKALDYAFISHLDSTLQRDITYMFFLNDLLNYDDEKRIEGDMPRGHQFGFLSGLSSSITIAHEIGHGLFRLKHTFDSDYEIEEQTTDNLMDYNKGTYLSQSQWRTVHDPGLVIGIFETDKDALSIKEEKKSSQKIIASTKIGIDHIYNKNRGIIFINSPYISNKLISEEESGQQLNLKFFKSKYVEYNRQWTDKNKDGKTSYDLWVHPKLDLIISSQDNFLRDNFNRLDNIPNGIPNKVMEFYNDFQTSNGVDIWCLCYIEDDARKVEYRKLFTIGTEQIIGNSNNIISENLQNVVKPDYKQILSNRKAWGFNAEINANISSSNHIGITGREGITMLFLLEGPYSGQPFFYRYNGNSTSSSIAKLNKISLSANVGLSAFCATSDLVGNEITPNTWTGWNNQSSFSVSLPNSLGAGASYFEGADGKGVRSKNKYWYDASFDISYTIGVKFDPKAYLALENGLTYSWLITKNIKPTNTLSFIEKLTNWANLAEWATSKSKGDLIKALNK